MSKQKPLFLCGAPPSSGSTLVSWCFLQRTDMDGVLDARNDFLPDIPEITTRAAWLKMTISVFRLSELATHYQDEGWQVHPLLVARDVRAVFNSILSKPYTSNGTTAEDPPFRLRLRRFKQDWQECRDKGWPVIQYESVVADAEQSLRKACSELGLEWDPAMLAWPKAKEHIAEPGHGSPTFRRSMGQSFGETADASHTQVRVDGIPPQDLQWLEEEFAEFNQLLEYPAHVAPAMTGSEQPSRAVPSWQNTRRSRKQRPIARISAVCTRMKNAVMKRQGGSSV